MARVRFAIVTVLCCSLLVGLARAADAPFTIPVITSLTGGGAFVGQTQADTLKRLETVVNRTGGIRGRPVTFRIYDDQSSPQIAVQALDGILDTKASAVIGPSLTNQCFAVLPLVKTSIVQYCLSPGLNAPKDSFAFSSSVGTPDVMHAFIRYFNGMGWKRVATITTSDSTGQQADQTIGAAVAAFAQDGEQIVDQEHFAPSDLSVAAQVARLEAAKPQVLLVWVIGLPFGTVVHALHDAGYDVPVGASNANMTFAQMKQVGEYLPKQLYFPGVPFLAGITPPGAHARQALQQFYSVTRDQGLKPDFQTGMIWDPAMLVVDAYRALGTDATPGQIHDFLEKTSGWAGVSGVYDFRDGSQRGLSAKDVVIMRWDAAKTNWVQASRLGGAPLR